MHGRAGEPASYDHLLKLLLIGDSGVGKSSILLRFAEDVFNEKQLSTIGVDFKVKAMTVGDMRLKLAIWDTAGQERFRTLTSSYYRGAQGIIMVYDVSNRQSFLNLQSWLDEIYRYSTNADAVLMLVSNKVDKRTVQVERREGEAFAFQKGMLFVETSAKTRQGVDHAFEELVQKILDTPSLLVNTSPIGAAPRQLSHAREGDALNAAAGCSC
ncbi:Rab18/RabC-family small GTPase [Toxoplasma gondii ME49]|uniref:Rab18/RabC-family small GTPase n=6 Tax=Toxoplasma gondii TaxID=5811 RepID=B6K906_TOXGV|nr:Rab18/RabC-family small GTPase [Toxoplasma gondii ME49]EPT25948.1 Rab18/RabC-family small GTPase [Toxoplasma gondii ME49]ESS35091.1 Rab18/RabC-family small GTPase [Toxoplasma gondii VEG]CEL77560.1 TPA: Ras family domain-containing protein [Toxoplasma gondii VEG]|eukprot:XP_002364530.1 Rab18/RabC-family small GTPase [Toxoplasma gondii ME49]